MLEDFVVKTGNASRAALITVPIGYVPVGYRQKNPAAQTASGGRSGALSARGFRHQPVRLSRQFDCEL
jgi:hypothetical protein